MYDILSDVEVVYYWLVGHMLCSSGSNCSISRGWSLIWSSISWCTSWTKSKDRINFTHSLIALLSVDVRVQIYFHSNSTKTFWAVNIDFVSRQMRSMFRVDRCRQLPLEKMIIIRRSLRRIGSQVYSCSRSMHWSRRAASSGPKIFLSERISFSEMLGWTIVALTWLTILIWSLNSLSLFSVIKVWKCGTRVR